MPPFIFPTALRHQLRLELRFAGTTPLFPRNTQCSPPNIHLKTRHSPPPANSDSCRPKSPLHALPTSTPSCTPCNPTRVSSSFCNLPPKNRKAPPWGSFSATLLRPNASLSFRAKRGIGFSFL